MKWFQEENKGIFVVAIVALVIILIGLTSGSTNTPKMTPEKETLKTKEELQKEAVEEVTGYYNAELRAASGPGRIIELTLSADMQATFEQDYQNGKPAIVETGTWDRAEDGVVEVMLDMKGESVLIEPDTLFFSYDAIAENLILEDYDEAVWGQDGLTLHKSVDLVGTKWLWVDTSMSDDSRTETDSLQSFSIAFQENGNLAMTTDCNNVRGTYTLSGTNNLTMTATAMTRKFCQESQETAFIKQLSQVESYMAEGERLSLILKLDSGTMTFTQTEFTPENN